MIYSLKKKSRNPGSNFLKVIKVKNQPSLSKVLLLHEGQPESIRLKEPLHYRKRWSKFQGAGKRVLKSWSH